MHQLISKEPKKEARHSSSNSKGPRLQGDVEPAPRPNNINADKYTQAELQFWNLDSGQFKFHQVHIWYFRKLIVIWLNHNNDLSAYKVNFICYTNKLLHKELIFFGP
jgi:hypothetical protein